jgi:hypothetical protein
MIAIRSVRDDLDWLFIRAFFSDLLFPRLGIQAREDSITRCLAGGSRGLVNY